MSKERLPEMKNTNPAQNIAANVGKAQQKSSAPSNRANPAPVPRVAVKRPPVHGARPAQPSSASQKPSSNGRVYPLNNTSAQGRSIQAQSSQKNSTPQKSTMNASGVKAPPKEKIAKEPRGPLITAEGVGQFVFVILISLVIYGLLCGIVYGVFYGINHLHFEWNYDITVKLDDSTNHPSGYTASKNTVFRGEGNEPYIAMSRLTNSLGLSAVGDADSIRFYKTGNKDGYAVFTDASKDVSVNGVIVQLPSPVYIVNGIAYVPISFFNYYTSGITISYDDNERMMTVLYTVDEALSTPKRKVLKEFVFCVNTPEALDELTEKEWFEYVGSQS